MNEQLDDKAVIARLRSALDEVTSERVGLVADETPRHTGNGTGRWLAVAAAVVLVAGGVTAVAINRNHHGSTPAADSTPTVPTVPTLIRTLGPWYVLASQDLTPGGIFGVENQLLADELTIAWALGGNPADGLLVLRSGPSSPALGPADTSLATYQMIGDQATAVASYGLTPQEQADLAAQIQPGSGLPWVLPVEGWAFLGMGVQTDGATRFTRYSNGTEAVDIAVGPLIDQFFTLATADTVEPVTVAGRAGWKATNADRVYVMWPAADSGRWATMTIVPALADRVDGLIAAVAEINDISENGPPPVVETIPAPVEHTYQGVASVIDTGSGPMIAFGFRDSLPPQGGDIPLAGFDWDMIDGEQSADGTTWFDGPVLFTGTFDGTTFTLTESAVADGSQIETGNLSHDALTPECTLEDMKPGLDLLGTLDFRALQILGTSSDNWDGRCGVYVHAAFDTPELRDALAPLGDQVTITIAFLDITD